jgi:hypothetical protein
MYSGKYNIFDVTLSVYIHTGQAEKLAWQSSWTSIPKATVGIEPMTFGILVQLLCQANFSACPVWIYTQNNIKNRKLVVFDKLSI